MQRIFHTVCVGGAWTDVLNDYVFLMCFSLLPFILAFKKLLFLWKQ